MARRSRAREVTLQLLFQWDQNPVAVPRGAIERFARDRLLRDDEMIAYSLALLDGVVSNKDPLDAAIIAIAENWRLSRMMPVDRNVLRLATYELLIDPNGQPLEVVINEAIELARRFGSAESPRFVNGVLDKIAKTRKTEPEKPSEAIAEPDLLPSPLAGEGGRTSAGQSGLPTGPAGPTGPGEG